MKIKMLEFDVWNISTSEKCLNDFVIDQSGHLFALVGTNTIDGIPNFKLVPLDKSIYQPTYKATYYHDNIER